MTKIKKPVKKKRRKKTLDKVGGKRIKIKIYNPDKFKGNKEAKKRLSKVGGDGNEYKRFIRLLTTLPSPKGYSTWMYYDHATKHLHGGFNRGMIEELGVPEDAKSITIEVGEHKFHKYCLEIAHRGYDGTKEEIHGEVFWGEYPMGDTDTMLYREILRKLNGGTYHPYVLYMLVHVDE